MIDAAIIWFHRGRKALRAGLATSGPELPTLATISPGVGIFPLRWFHTCVQLVPRLHGDPSPESFRITVHVMSVEARPGYHKIDLAFGGGPSMHRPTSPVASNPGRSHPLNVAGLARQFRTLRPRLYSIAPSLHMVVAFRPWRT